MKPFILIVEDLEELRLLAMLTLSPLGRVDCVPDSASAIERMRQEVPAVLVLDVMLGPGENGLDLCRGLKSSPATAAIRILLVSACGQQSDIEAGLASGADRYIVKPFSPEHLYDTVAELLG
jgi:DNA-binding response OmpR family regulator